VEQILQILIVLILAGSVLKLSFWRWWQAGLFGAVCAAFVIGACEWATMQSKTQLADFLANPAAMQDAAVLVTVDAALLFAFCLAELFPRRAEGGRRWWRPLLKWYPGLLLFPALFYLETQLIFAMSGVDFTAISYALAAGIAAAIPTLGWLLGRVVREREQRLELMILVGLFVCVMGLVATVNGNVTYTAVSGATDMRAIAMAAGTFAALFAAGLAWNKLKWKIVKNK